MPPPIPVRRQSRRWLHRLAALAVALLATPALALVEDCRRLELVAERTGERVVGVEDIRIAPSGTRAYLSAHDRRADPPVDGAIHPLDLDRLEAAPARLEVAAWRPEPPTAGGFRPHGIALDPNGDLLAVNRRVAEDGSIEPSIDRLEVHPNGLNEVASFRVPELCNPNGLFVMADGRVLATNDRAACEPWRLRLETWLGRATGSVVELVGGTAEPLISGLAHANGIAALGNELWFAETRGGRVTMFSPFGPELARSHALDFAPDNLTVDEHGRLWTAGPASLLAYAAFVAEWPWFERTRSRVAMIDAGEVTPVLDDDGSLISGATVAAAGGGWLLIGAAYDDAIAYCRLRS